MGQYCTGREKQIQDPQYTTDYLQQSIAQHNLDDNTMQTPLKRQHPQPQKYLSASKSQQHWTVKHFLSSNKVQKETQQLYTCFVEGDVKRLTMYLDVYLKLQRPLAVPHEWAQPVTTVAALATELLAELLELDEEDQLIAEHLDRVTRYRQSLTTTALDQKLANNITSELQDLREWSLILLIILVQDHPSCQDYLANQRLVDALTTQLDPHCSVQVRMYAFEVLGQLVVGRMSLLDHFFTHTNKSFLLSFFQVKEIDLVFRAIYGLMELIEDGQTLNHKNKVASHLFFLKSPLMQTQEDLLFVSNQGTNQNNDKRQYILAAIRRIVEFIDHNYTPIQFDTA